MFKHFVSLHWLDAGRFPVCEPRASNLMGWYVCASDFSVMTSSTSAGRLSTSLCWADEPQAGFDERRGLNLSSGNIKGPRRNGGASAFSRGDDDAK
jgi:hypothetical protein